MKMDEPEPDESLLVFNRIGEDLVLLDGIALGHGLVRTGISRNNATSITSNPNRITNPAEPIPDPARSVFNRELRDAILGT
jgi:hypothetical protein